MGWFVPLSRRNDLPPLTASRSWGLGAGVTGYSPLDGGASCSFLTPHSQPVVRAHTLACLSLTLGDLERRTTWG